LGADIVKPVASPDPFGLVGQVLDGQFRVDRFVGEGGFSSVYQGTHVGLSEPIAVKCLKLPPALGSALVESFIRRFRDESRLHYRLSQGNLHIARSIASGTTIAPATSALVPYTVLEWLEGTSLDKDFTERRAAGHKGRPLSEVVQLLDSAVDAIAYAHAQGVVHRDLNPGNFFLAKTPVGTKLKVLDFGVAKVMADSALAIGPTAKTVGNVRIFAPAYGAPEQFDERAGVIGPWTDVYTLALVALEALVDRTIMEGEHIGQFAAKALDPVNRPTPHVVGAATGAAVEKVFARALAVNPTDRPRDAGEWWGLLKNSMQRDAQATVSVPPTERLERKSQTATLRISEVVPLLGPVTERTADPRRGGLSSRPPPGASTLRIDRDVRRSATEALVATPIPPRASQLPSPLPVIPPPSPTPPPGPTPAVDRSAIPPSVALDPVVVPKLPVGWMVAVAIGVVVMVVTLAASMGAWRARPVESIPTAPSH
jgi:eukaryotic-like serine/threonine-protein kinase